MQLFSSSLIKMASDVGFFKCIDDSAKLLSQYSDQPVYYYNYAHKGQHSITQMLGVPDDIDFGKKLILQKKIFKYIKIH